MSRYQMTWRSIWNFSSAQDFFFKKYQNCNLSFLKKHTSNEFQIEGDKSHEYPLRIYIHENIYQSKLQGSGICLYWLLLRTQKILVFALFVLKTALLSANQIQLLFFGGILLA